MDITERMGNGMAEFVDKDMGQGTVDIPEYNRYCHFVAGLVGEGLSRLFAVSGLEDKSFSNESYLANQMGLFLQKTNIIRDYLEDYVDKRAWWPQSVWTKYSLTGDLGYFANETDPQAKSLALSCLNELVTDALELAPDCLAYMSKLRCEEIFRFCAIPQVMAIATLDKCYANHDVFTGVVKIRKGLSCKLILRTNNLAELHEVFHQFASSIMQTANRERQNGVLDPSYSRTIRICEKVLELTSALAIRQRQARRVHWLVSMGMMFAAVVLKFVMTDVAGFLDSHWNAMLSSSVGALAVLVYFFGPWTFVSNLASAKVLDRV